MAPRGTIVRVAVPVPLPGSFDYLWPGPGDPPVPGTRVRVPLGRGERVGTVLGTAGASDVAPEKLKPLLAVLDTAPIIGEELLATLAWCADYYHHPIGEVVSQALPVLLRQGRPPPSGLVAGHRLTAAGREESIDAVAPRAPRQAEALEILRAQEELADAELRDLGVGRDTVARLVAKGWAEPVTLPERVIEATRTGLGTAPDLTDDQAAALAAIRSDTGYHAYLLQGVTGSGKTEVYLQLIQSQLEAGKQSLLLVPEIGLTPQLVARLEDRFGERLALMHSNRPDVERLRAWHDAFLGEAKVIVGTRSAVFAPLPMPGLIVVDEEHDASYKQHEGFRYSARDLAVYRARQLKVPVVLASATPSLESIHNARQDRYRLLSMPRRIGSAGEPAFHVIDLNRHAARHGLSTPLISAMERHLAAENQVMLFLNRRGFAPVLFCAECRAVEECSHCDSRLTVHASSGRLRCHHCGAQSALSWACSSCGSERIAVGAGTQRVDDELRALFPTSNIARLDRDVATRHAELTRVLAEVEAGDTQILVGTQMLTKGHDFPRVTMVGVLDADQGLLGADFRSNERLAQTLLQVAGRAGRRDQPGEVFVQTHFPAHPLLRCLTQRSYSEFAELALAEREASQWPPFAHLIVWRAQAAARAPAHDFLARVAREARRIAGPVSVLGPAAAPMERRGGRFRAQLLFRCTDRAALHTLAEQLDRCVRNWPEARRVRFSIDVDPAEL